MLTNEKLVQCMLPHFTRQASLFVTCDGEEGRLRALNLPSYFAGVSYCRLESIWWTQPCPSWLEAGHGTPSHRDPGLLSNDEDGARRMVDHASGNAAEQRATDRPQAFGAGNDQIDLLLFGLR